MMVVVVAVVVRAREDFDDAVVVGEGVDGWLKTNDNLLELIRNSLIETNFSNFPERQQKIGEKEVNFQLFAFESDIHEHF